LLTINTWYSHITKPVQHYATGTSATDTLKLPAFARLYADILIIAFLLNSHAKVLIKVKGLDIYILPLTGKPEQQQFTIRTGPPLAVGSTAQLAAAHCLNEWTFGPAVCS